MKSYILLLSVLLTGCQVDGKVSGARDMICKDTRDGETFSFLGNSIRDVRIGFGDADTCFKVTDNQGIERVLCKSMETYIKCSPKGVEK